MYFTNRHPEHWLQYIYGNLAGASNVSSVLHPRRGCIFYLVSKAIIYARSPKAGNSSTDMKMKRRGVPERRLELVFIGESGHEFKQCHQRSSILGILDAIPHVLRLLQLPRASPRQRLLAILLAGLGPGLGEHDCAPVAGRLSCAGELVEPWRWPCRLALVAQLLQHSLGHADLHESALSQSFR